MSKIEEIWAKYSDLTTETMRWWHFEAAADELCKLQKLACYNAWLEDGDSLLGAGTKILTADLEEK